MNGYKYLKQRLKELKRDLIWKSKKQISKNFIKINMNYKNPVSRFIFDKQSNEKL